MVVVWKIMNSLCEITRWQLCVDFGNYAQKQLLFSLTCRILWLYTGFSLDCKQRTLRCFLGISIRPASHTMVSAVLVPFGNRHISGSAMSIRKQPGVCALIGHGKWGMNTAAVPQNCELYKGCPFPCMVSICIYLEIYRKIHGFRMPHMDDLGSAMAAMAHGHSDDSERCHQHDTYGNGSISFYKISCGILDNFSHKVPHHWSQLCELKLEKHQRKISV